MSTGTAASGLPNSAAAAHANNFFFNYNYNNYNPAAAAGIPNTIQNGQFSTSSAGTARSNVLKSSSSLSSSSSSGFQVPLHYPRYKKADYEKMTEPQLDILLRAYGLPAAGDVDQKRKFAMGTFLWPDQY